MKHDIISEQEDIISEQTDKKPGLTVKLKTNFPEKRNYWTLFRKRIQTSLGRSNLPASGLIGELDELVSGEKSIFESLFITYLLLCDGEPTGSAGIAKSP